MNVLQYWYIGPWRWDDSDASMPHWAPPAGCSGLDLRSLPEQSQQGSTPGLGLFWGPVKPAAVGSDYTFLGSGSWHDIKSTGKMRDALRLPGRRRWRGDAPDLVGLVFQIMTDGSDPTGDDGPKPLMPNRHGQLLLNCGQRYRQRFRWGKHLHTNRVQSLLQRDFSRQMDDATAGRMKDREHHRRILDFSREKYSHMGLADWRDLVPVNRRRDVPGPLKHETTITDDFSRADADALGSSSEGWSWTEVSGDCDIRLSQAQGQSTGRGRAESDLSSADHSTSVSVADIEASLNCGPCGRFDPSADTCYVYLIDNNNGGAGTDVNRIFKVVSGSLTLLSAGSSESPPSYPVTAVLECDGSSLEALQGATTKVSVTDSAITGNVRTGMYYSGSAGNNTALDDFEATDLSAPAGVTYTQLERDVRGMNRGIWTGGIG